jgi:hypothetical protein
MCLNGTDADNAPGEYTTAYKDSPDDMSEELRSFAEDPNDPIVAAEIADLAPMPSRHSDSRKQQTLGR